MYYILSQAENITPIGVPFVLDLHLDNISCADMGEKRSRQHDGQHESKSKRHEIDNSSASQAQISKLNSKFPPQTSGLPLVPHYQAHKALGDSRNEDLPPLPPMSNPKLAAAVFVHPTARSEADAKVRDDSATYDPLEFLGDAYIEVIATRLLHARFPHFHTGKKAQTREQLVKNETLAEYARAYGFDKPGVIKANGEEMLNTESRWTKILGDVIEAYVGAVVESDPEKGFKMAEEWLTALWTPKLLAVGNEARPSLNVSDLKMKMNNLLQNAVARVMVEYTETKPSEHSEGKTRYFREVRLTGWGHEKKVLGRGEALSMKQAEAVAIQDAFEKNMPLIMEANAVKKEFERKNKEEKERNATS